MKHNLQTRPKLHKEAIKNLDMNYITDVEEWFKGLEEELQQLKQRYVGVEGDPVNTEVKLIIDEILGVKQ